MTFEHLLVQRTGPHVTVTLDRPQQRNALSLALISELKAAVTEVAGSDATGMVLAANGPVFSAGHDFRDIGGRSLEQVTELVAACADLMQLLSVIPQVVIAKVHALATAAGAQLVASCDLAVASDTAGFAAPGGKGGWFCHTPMVALARDIGRKRAMELALTGDVIDAATALEWGLVNRVVPAGELDAATSLLLSAATRGSREGKALGKQTMYRQLSMSQEEAYSHAVQVMAEASQLADAQEGVAAFLEKRQPIWQP